VIGVEQVEHGAVALEEVGEEADRLLVHRAAQRGEGREQPFALLVEFDRSRCRCSHCAAELAGEAPHAGIAEHAARLGDELTSGSRRRPAAASARSSSSGTDDQRK
jgi:hypothetical protein